MLYSIAYNMPSRNTPDSPSHIDYTAVEAVLISTHTTDDTFQTIALSTLGHIPNTVMPSM